jgi:hypothetical protein
MMSMSMNTRAFTVDGGVTQNLPKQKAAALGKANMKSLDLKDMNIVAAGGYYNVQQLAANPKGALVAMIVDALRTGQKEVRSEEDLEGVLGLLMAQGKGFATDLVDGDWISVLDKSTTKSPKLQKAVERKDKAGLSTANFDVTQQKFFGSAMLGKRTELRSTVQYNPVGAGFTTTSYGGKVIVIRRIMCDIVGASLKLWRFPRIPLPLRAKGGYLDFIYMDNDIRITKGNRGGTFVHFRPDFLEKVM